MTDSVPPSTPGRHRPTSHRARPSRRGWPSRIVPWVVVVIVAVGIVLALRHLRPSEGGLEKELASLPESQAEAPPPAGDRAVVLVFPEWDATGYVTEERRIPSEGHPEEDLLQLMNELCTGPSISGAISALPQRTKPLAAFIHQDDHSAVVDFSAELVTRHPGGSAAELATLTSILRTVALNFPELETCQILVDGAQVQTLSGHLTMDVPFQLHRWL